MRISLLAVGILVLILLLGCCGSNATQNKIPDTATNVKDEGNGWVSFDCGGHRFLGYRLGKDYGSVLTRVE